MREPDISESIRPSVVVVTWNGGPLLRECVDALRRQTLQPASLIVVVARPDPIPLPTGLEVIRCSEAQGYAASVNIGAAASPPGPLIILNDDTVPDPDFIQSLVRAQEERGEGLFSPRIMLVQGSNRLDNTGHRLFFDGYNLARGRGRSADEGASEATEAGACSGAAFMLSSRAREQLGGFDADLESFGEDLDLSLRARRQGFRIHYVDSARIRHHLGASYGRVTWRKIYLVERNRLRAALRSLPLSAIATMPAWTGLRLTGMGLSASLGRGPGAGAGLKGASAALLGGIAGLVAAPDALRKRASDRSAWIAGEREMWSHLLQHRVRARDLVGRA
jgi:GT2 family glycosyltransferase